MNDDDFYAALDNHFAGLRAQCDDASPASAPNGADPRAADLRGRLSRLRAGVATIIVTTASASEGDLRVA